MQELIAALKAGDVVVTFNTMDGPKTITCIFDEATTNFELKNSRHFSLNNYVHVINTEDEGWDGFLMDNVVSWTALVTE
jgi:uncharacterized protein YjdB